jgi:hypothetical protein
MIGTESHTRQIGDYTYTALQMAATPAISLLTKLMKLGGPALKSVGEADDKWQAIALALGGLLERLDEKEVQDIIARLAASCLVELDPNKGPVPLKNVFESHFKGGNLKDMFAVLLFVLEVNYADFFGGSGIEGVRAMLAQALAGAPKSPNTYGGQPGA